MKSDAESATAVVTLRGGFAHLAQRGSYKKPGGYKIPRRGVHPGIKAQPFWEVGLAVAAPKVPLAYYTAVVAELKKHF